jgi:predicted DNA-binding transcriptional regulator AlpA
MPNQTTPPRLLRDKQIADILSVSSSWVRKERFNRRKGNAHVLDIDPVMIGSAPRYQLSAIEDWLKRQPGFGGL